MAIKFYLIPTTSVHPEAEIESYEECGSLTDFPRGTWLAYRNKGLVCGFATRREAERWRDEGVYDETRDLWIALPPRESNDREKQKMRCPTCNKFAAYDDSAEPEVEVTLEDDGTFNGTARIVLTHDECGEELKEGSFEFDGEIPEAVLNEHKGDGHSLDIEADGSELTVRTEGSGRYMKTFYGYSTNVDVTCSCQASRFESLWSMPFDEDMQASHMDELV